MGVYGSFLEGAGHERAAEIEPTPDAGRFESCSSRKLFGG